MQGDRAAAIVRTAIVGLGLGLASAACSSSSTSAGRAPRSVGMLADEYYSALLRDRPLLAFFKGVPGADLESLGDNSLQALARWQAREDGWTAELERISPPRGDAGELVTYSVLQEALQSAKAARVCRDELWAVSQLSGPHQLPGRLATTQPLGSPERRRRALARWGALARYLDTEVTNLREGVRRGYTAPRPNVRAVIEQLDSLLAGGERSPASVLAARDEAPEFRQAIAAAWQESLRPALARYRSYLATEYLASARSTVAIAALPEGLACYRARLRAFTTLQVEPSVVHRLGLDEGARIRAELRALASGRFGNIDLDSLFERLRTDQSLRFHSRQEILDAAQTALARAKQAAAGWFPRIPRALIVLEPCLPSEERSGCPNSYLRAAQDGSRPGRWRVNTNPERMSRLEIEVIAFHEGYPGHHLQAALTQERAELHPLTRVTSNAGFVEGWGLYAERLAEEMGLYSSDLSRLGQLSAGAFRAARLVVDTGIHSLGWSREHAVEYLLANTSLPRPAAIAEVDRYVINPGQATAYMLGQLEIERLRREAERRLGPRFDVRVFHERVLEQGAVPLGLLGKTVGEWLDRAAGGADAAKGAAARPPALGMMPSAGKTDHGASATMDAVDPRQ